MKKNTQTVKLLICISKNSIKTVRSSNTCVLHIITNKNIIQTHINICIPLIPITVPLFLLHYQNSHLQNRKQNRTSIVIQVWTLDTITKPVHHVRTNFFKTRRYLNCPYLVTCLIVFVPETGICSQYIGTPNHPSNHVCLIHYHQSRRTYNDTFAFDFCKIYFFNLFYSCREYSSNDL